MKYLKYYTNQAKPFATCLWLIHQIFPLESYSHDNLRYLGGIPYICVNLGEIRSQGFCTTIRFMAYLPITKIKTILQIWWRCWNSATKIIDCPGTIVWGQGWWRSTLSDRCGFSTTSFSRYLMPYALDWLYERLNWLGYRQIYSDRRYYVYGWVLTWYELQPHSTVVRYLYSVSDVQNFMNDLFPYGI